MRGQLSLDVGKDQDVQHIVAKVLESDFGQKWIGDRKFVAMLPYLSFVSRVLGSSV